MIVTKTPEQVQKMADAGAILVRCLKMLRKSARPGVTTQELDLAALVADEAFMKIVD